MKEEIEIFAKINEAEDFKNEVKSIVSLPWINDLIAKLSKKSDLNRNYFSILLLQLDQKLFPRLNSLLNGFNIDELIKNFTNEKSFFMRCCYIEVFLYYLSTATVNKDIKTKLLNIIIQHFNQNMETIFTSDDGYYQVIL